jgi:5-methylcytosine-specific restriction endonuclease McrA
VGKRQRDWARRAYDRLILDLGGKCAKCGTLSSLTIDHIEGCDYEHETYEWSHRISVYRQEARDGKLQVLCEPCNRQKGRPEPKPDDDGQFDLFTYQPPENGDPF